MPTIVTSPPPQITIEARSRAIDIDVCGCSTVIAVGMKPTLRGLVAGCGGLSVARKV